MQPPPRKGKPTTLLKNTHSEQLVKLQMKHQQDSDFLDDIRNFTKMRAVIEKDYAQSLLKLATSHLQKKAPVVPDGKSEDGESYKTVYSVWKTMLDETEKIAKARLAAAEVYQQQVSETSKSLRLYKLQVAKKCFENLKKMHEEIQTCVTEIEKTKKLYFEEEHMAHEAREKAHDADEKLKRKKGRIFQSITSLQKNSAKFSFRREACDIQATKARNDYVLALLAANAHQSKFYETDLPELVQYIDCDIYDKVKEYILLIARTELLTCAACQSSFSTIQDQANMASGQYTMNCFFQTNTVLSQPILYEFEPCDGDKINKLSIEHNAALCLSKEARRWASCVAKEIRVTRDSKAELRKLLAQIGDKPPYALQSDQIGPQAELEARIDELRQIIRRSQTSKKKAEARLEAMREAGVNVEEWLKILEQESVIAQESPKENFSRSGTVTSRGSPKSNISEPTFEESDEVNDAVYDDSDTAPEPTSAPADSVSEASYMPDYTSTVDVVAAIQVAWDAAAETEEIEEPEVTEEPIQYQQPETQEVVVNGEVPTAGSGQRCVALFSYEAVNSDELSFVEQEELELISEGDGDGWVMARNYKGEEGYIPQNYVEVVEAPSADTSSRPPLTSFSSVDYTMPSEDKDAGLYVDESVPTADTAAVVDATATSSEVERPVDLPAAPAAVAPTERIQCCQAVYDYEATCDEELTFFEGQIIRILRKNVFDVDDGWWEGEIDGKIGLFPSLVVEELKENGEPLTPMTPMSPPESCPPPPFTPPEAELITDAPTQIILTQPTPEIEHPANTEQKAVAIIVDEDFHLELSKKQQQQYQEQFSASDTESSEHEAPDQPLKHEGEGVEEGQITAKEAENNETKTPEEDVAKYAPLVSSPDSPTKSAADEKATDKDDGAEVINTDINTEIKAPSPGIEECPTVVVTSITAGDTPTSDDDMELKEKEEPPKENDEPPKENDADESAHQNTDEFECTFPDIESDVVSNQQVPSSSETVVEFGQKSATEEPPTTFTETEKMEVNGVDGTKTFFNDSQNAETTG